MWKKLLPSLLIISVFSISANAVICCCVGYIYGQAYAVDAAISQVLKDERDALLKTLEEYKAIVKEQARRANNIDSRSDQFLEQIEKKLLGEKKKPESFWQALSYIERADYYFDQILNFEAEHRMKERSVIDMLLEAERAEALINKANMAIGKSFVVKKREQQRLMKEEEF